MTGGLTTGAVLGLLLAAVPLVAAVGGAERFLPPSGPVELVHDLRKPLAGGRSIVVHQHFRLHFGASAGGGWRVAAECLDSHVSAPPEVAVLAALEGEACGGGEPFPLILDAGGRILGQDVSPDEAGRRDAQVRAAVARLLDARALTGPARAEALDVVARLQVAARVAGPGWPVDLFRPDAASGENHRSVTLPDGGLGEIVIWQTRTGSSGPLPARVERRIGTGPRDSGTPDESVESWAFTWTGQTPG